jgi:hypothetical protein
MHTICFSLTNHLQVRYVAKTVVKGKLLAFLQDLTSVSYKPSVIEYFQYFTYLSAIT